MVVGDFVDVLEGFLARIGQVEKNPQARHQPRQDVGGVEGEVERRRRRGAAALRPVGGRRRRRVHQAIHRVVGGNGASALKAPPTRPTSFKRNVPFFF